MTHFVKHQRRFHKIRGLISVFRTLKNKNFAFVLFLKVKAHVFVCFFRGFLNGATVWARELRTEGRRFESPMIWIDLMNRTRGQCGVFRLSRACMIWLCNYCGKCRVDCAKQRLEEAQSVESANMCTDYERWGVTFFAKKIKLITSQNVVHWT